MGYKSRDRVLPEGTRNVAGINVPVQGLGNVPTTKEYVAPATGVNSTAAVANQVALANAEDAQAKAIAIPGYVDTVQDGGFNNGTKVNVAKAAKGITTKSDKTYVDSLKINSAERYNELLSRKAFNSGNTEIMAIAKKLGINKNGSVKKPRTPSAEVKAKKKAEAIKIITEDPTMENPVTKSAIPEVFSEVPEAGIVTPANRNYGSTSQTTVAQPSIEEIINGMGANRFTKMVTPYSEAPIIYDPNSVRKPKSNY